MKIFNDPVHGFIEVPPGRLLRILDHPIVQRLRRIKQMGASSLVYPGGEHTRLNHALGAMHLTQLALRVLRAKGAVISPEEEEATLAAILLHDVGHGPFSHALESLLVPGVSHERLSLALMNRLAAELGDPLPLAIQIFTGSYPRHFLHQLVSSQLDMDRMDYLSRDSFFTGVSEGIVGVDRIIKTLVLHTDSAGRETLAVEEKGAYSIEKFLIARRLMYWQVYFHKTALSAETMFGLVVKRARTLYQQGAALACPDPLRSFLQLPEAPAPALDADLLDDFVLLDDHDIYGALKLWRNTSLCPDPILHELATRLLDRRLLKLRYRRQPVTPDERAAAERKAQELGYTADALAYFVLDGSVQNQAYKQEGDSVSIRYKDGTVCDIVQASDLSNLETLAQPVTKYYLATPF